MTLRIAHTGIRRSEAIGRFGMTLIFVTGQFFLVREKKRSRTRAITFRRVELTDEFDGTRIPNWNPRRSTERGSFDG